MIKDIMRLNFNYIFNNIILHSTLKQSYGKCPGSIANLGIQKRLRGTSGGRSPRNGRCIYKRLF